MCALHALLIGIDRYVTGGGEDGASRIEGHYPNLEGCVHDVELMAAHLRHQHGVPDQQIRRLTARLDTTEPRSSSPTYEILVGALETLRDGARPGDHLFIHYSGHGGRVPTTCRGKQTRWDETLVPTGIDNPDQRHLRDHEIVHLLRSMLNRDLLVTLVLDCCHSGGIVRQGRGGAQARGNGQIDRTPRPPASLVGSPKELAAAWRWAAGSASVTRGIRPGLGSLPNPDGYVLLAACRPHEKAFEYAFDGVHLSGALTWWLLEICGERPRLTVQSLYDQLLPKIHSYFPMQTPLLEGDLGRLVFETQRREVAATVNVLAVDEDRVQLGAGQAQGLFPGNRFTLAPATDQDQSDRPPHQTLMVVEEVEASSAWARIHQQGRHSPMPGDGAVQLDLGPGPTRIRTLFQSPDLRVSLSRALAENNLEIGRAGSRYLELLPEDSADQAHFTVLENAEALLITDGKGHPLAGVSALPRRRSSRQLVRRLSHLAKFRYAGNLRHPDPASPLHTALELELGRLPADYSPTESPARRRLEIGETPYFRAGEWFTLTVKNVSRRALNVTVLDLDTEWGITQIFPVGSAFAVFDPDQLKVLAFQAVLPDRLNSGTDLIKAFATVDASRFSWLELPPLDGDVSWTRNRGFSTFASREWSTAELELQLIRKTS